jgi:hypothetical protein
VREERRLSARNTPDPSVRHESSLPIASIGNTKRSGFSGHSKELGLSPIKVNGVWL